jgi:3-(3-hydroxy-phenyl)propionate hydroxylase
LDEESGIAQMIVYILSLSHHEKRFPLSQAHVMISGAGPVGMVSALVLARAGVKVTLAESAPALSMDLRASTFHPPTLDMLAPLGLTDDLISQGLIARYTQQRDRQEGLIAEFDMELLRGDTDHPFRLQCEQWKLTQLIKNQLDKMPHVTVHLNTKVEGVDQTADGVTTRLSTDGQAHEVKSDYLIGADGAWSAVRKSQNIEFEGFTYPERFLVVSTAFEYADHLPKLSYVNYCSDPKEWCVLLRVPTLWRVLFPTKVEETDEEVMGDESVERRLQGLLPQAVPYQTVHRTLYKVHQRVAKNFRHGRVLLAGDSAHINNPLGGMGMNGGVHDAMNLCQKLLGVIQQGHSADVLQRRSIAIEYINANTARNKKEIEERDPVARKKTQDELRAIAADPKSAKAYIRKTSMLDALERAEAIA